MIAIDNLVRKAEKMMAQHHYNCYAGNHLCLFFSIEWRLRIINTISGVLIIYAHHDCLVSCMDSGMISSSRTVSIVSSWYSGSSGLLSHFDRIPSIMP